MLTQYKKNWIFKLSLNFFPDTVQSGTVSKMGPVYPTSRTLWIRPHGNNRTFTFITGISPNETFPKGLKTVFN
jgi:hypothetical protein